MKTTPSNLLKDTLETALSNSDQERLIEAALQAAQGRRRRRKTRNAVAILAIACWAGLQSLPDRGEPSLEPPSLADSGDQLHLDSKPQYLEGTEIRIVSDQELLAAISSRPAVILGDLSDGAVIFFDTHSQRRQR